MSVTARTVPAMSGLKIPAARPIVSIVRAMPENVLLRMRSRIEGR